MSDELKPLPCPFCGAHLVFCKSSHAQDYYDHPGSGCVLADGYLGDVFMVFDDPESIAAWNRRSPAIPVEPQEPVAKLHQTIIMFGAIEGKSFEAEILDRARCYDGMHLYAKPLLPPTDKPVSEDIRATDSRDAERYRTKKAIDLRKIELTSTYSKAPKRDQELMRRAWEISYDAAIDAAMQKDKT